jgi:hypothetical protein
MSPNHTSLQAGSRKAVFNSCSHSCKLEVFLQSGHHQYRSHSLVDLRCRGEGLLHPLSLARIFDILYDQPHHLEGEPAPVGALGCGAIVVGVFIAKNELEVFLPLMSDGHLTQLLGMGIDIEVELGEDAELGIIGSNLQVLVFIIAFHCCG